jgi:GGDEF domain-containing protein
MARILILGGGFGGVVAAEALAQQLGDERLRDSKVAQEKAQQSLASKGLSLQSYLMRSATPVSLPKSLSPIAKLLKPSFRLGAQEVYVTASMGISLFPMNGEDSTEILKNAGPAL